MEACVGQAWRQRKRSAVLEALSIELFPRLDGVLVLLFGGDDEWW